MNQSFERIAVIDVGKTNAKVVLVDGRTGTELAVRKTANRVIPGPPYPHFDIEALWAFMLRSLKEFAAGPGFDALSITTHGASAALLNNEGGLALPVLDYEHLYPDAITETYGKLRPDFSETFSPALTGGLNVGAQLHYQRTTFPDQFDKVATILTYPQYWAYRLTGVPANERTSLGCHTDLWHPFEGGYSDLVDTLHIRERMAPLRSAFDALGLIRREVADAIGLNVPVPVYCGLHDSNASLLPHLVGFGSPCTVVSTGTWVICFGVGAKPQRLDPSRDTLVNVDANGHAVPSSRFMGGREWDLLTRDLAPVAMEEELVTAAATVIEAGSMLLPSVVTGTGPFPNSHVRWLNEPQTAAERLAAASLYEALMTQTCLDLIEAEGPIIVEGPFAANQLYLRALHTLTKRPVHVSESSTGTAIGAALLTGITLDVKMRSINNVLDGLEDYAREWRSRAGEH
ncbi:MAG: FGGY-family carbohydrate kinase [Agrobacterium albertimagni]|uniref:Sugar kinase n=1 Tax=Agrobacterium albertimagni AOL15 TaxID=1156935 RepID=K2Q920_9HYPH|nr:FGGY-family carbohydrate kinase [Agrobacterium albertimagni]EKF57481.1 sugar kinase [Agrobacterium albertimagni AOL15]